MNDKPLKAAENFAALVDAVRRVHDECAAAVNRTVNTTLTLRNRLIGSYIRDYDQNGADRAQYGTHLLEELSDSLQGCLDRCYTGRYLGLCRRLFDAYPAIRKSAISELGADSWTLIQRLSFTHEHLGQLNTYVSWYRKHMMTDGDGPPVGLLLCTQKDHTLVEYATADMDNRLFVSKYQLEPPKKEELERFLQNKRREITEG